jgi:uncharacterized membrane protein
LIRIIALLLLLVPTTVQAQELPAFFSVTDVASDDVLNLRAGPDATSAVIGSLPADATGIEVVDVEGNWAVVNVGEVTGYAAIGYLTREEGPDWTALQTPMTCLGTEPFWSLEIDPAKGETRSRLPEDAADQIATLTEAWPGQSPWAPSAAVALPQGLAVLQPLQCSDGMSERSFGIVIDIFLTGTDAAAPRSRLSGCCSLTQP